MLYKRNDYVKAVITVVLLLALMLTVTSCNGNDDPPPAPNGDKPDNSTNDPAQAGWEPIVIKLPSPMFDGTPEDIRVPGGKLDKPLGKPRAPFLAPPGTTNVAFKKPVTASDPYPVYGESEMVTDGDKEATDGSWVDLGPYPQHVTIDLEAEHEIWAVIVWHYHKQPRAYMDVVVQIANDPDFINDVKIIFNNDHDNSLGFGAGSDYHYVETAEGKLIEGKGIKGRYVRLHSNGNSSTDSSHYIEVEVYGRPAK